MSGGDVGMVQRGERKGFAFEAREALRVGGELVGQDFDGDVTAEANVARQPDAAHAAIAERRGHLVGPYPVTHGEAHVAIMLVRCSPVQSSYSVRKSPREAP